MKSLTLKHLRYFDALARHGHFGRAAKACSISQPALSLQIKDLEAMTGSALVERTARQIGLTPFGETFLARARSILVRVDEMEELVRAAQGPLSGRLRIGIIPTVAPYLLPKILSALTQRFANLDVRVRETVTDALIDDLSQARLDVAIVALPISEPTLQEFALFEEDFVLVRPGRDKGLPVPSAELLQTMQLLLLEEGHCFRDQALSFCKLADAQPHNFMEGSSLSTLVQMVGSGMGVTLIPEMALALETRSADVSIARFPAPKPSRTVGMVWRKSNPLSEQLMQIGAIVRGIGQEAKMESRIQTEP